MTTLERIKELCKENSITVSALEAKLDLPNNTIYQWKSRTPGTDRLQKVADHFGVSVDYLLGRTDKKRYYDLTEKDEENIKKQLKKVIDGEDVDTAFAAFDGRLLDDLSKEDRELLINSWANTFRLTRRMAKEKFTPKKYR